jgi:sigma-E factor negative regulatory protein RseA
MNEKVSALLDGALDDLAATRMLDTLKRDGALRQEWDSYCLIGDALRDEPQLSTDFTASLMARLEDEPVILAPVHARERQAQPAVEEQTSWFRHLMPVAASVMGVAVVGWAAMTFNQQGRDAGQQMAARQAPLASQARNLTLASASAAETSEREYLFAHQAMAPSAAMPGAAQYVRTVADVRVAGQR